MNILAIRQALNNSGPQAAERQLALLGDNQGDDQLAVLVRDLSAGEVSQLLAEGDYTKPSVVAHHITPQQFLGALHRLGARWGSVKGAELSALLSIKELVSDFVLSALLHGYDENLPKLIKAVLEDNLAEDVLVMIALFESGCPEFLHERDWSTAQTGTWQELYLKVKDAHEPSFTLLRGEVLGLFGDEVDGDEEKDDAEGGSKKATRFLQRTLQALANKAAELGETSPKSKKTEEIFEDL